MNSKNKKFTIMVVDDSRISRKIVLLELSNGKDFHLVDYDNPLNLLKELETIRPDMIVSDFDMPQINGFELCAAIRQHPEFKDIPFVLVSGSVDIDVRGLAIQIGVTELFLKPFKHFSLFKYVSQYIDSNKKKIKGSALIIEKRFNVRRDLRRILEEFELKVYEAETTLVADEIIEKYPIDLIFLAQGLANKDSLQWCKKLKDSQDHIVSLVIGITSDYQQALAFSQSGADAYLGESLIHEEVFLCIEAQLKHLETLRKLESVIIKEKAVSKQKNKLLGMAAHDLRNPLTIIREYASILKEGWGDKEVVQSAMDGIYDSANHTIALINDILDVSAIESGVVMLKVEQVALHELLEERVQFMNKVAHHKNITGTFIKKQVDEKILLASIDKAKIAQVIDNLISNAIKYSPKNVTYEVTLRQVVEGALIEVIDHGQGIPQDEVGQIFDAFKRTSVQATGGEKSTGLGLSIVKKLIESHDGQIWVKSEQNKGSIFSVVLPSINKMRPSKLFSASSLRMTASSPPLTA